MVMHRANNEKYYILNRETLKLSILFKIGDKGITKLIIPESAIFQSFSNVKIKKAFLVQMKINLL